MPDMKKSIRGFTLVELLVVVVIIGILAAISLANFVGAQNKAKNAAIKGNMRTIQIASEAYSTDSGGAYATDATGTLLNYLPSGSNTITGGQKGTMPINPLTGKASSIADAGISDSKALQTMRNSSGGKGVAPSGDPAYSQVDGGSSYAVTGTDSEGNYILSSSGPLVLSNQ